MLKPFEDDLIKLVRNVEFKRIESPFLKKLNEDAKFITENENIFVFADKTTNIYSVSKENYEKVLKENVTKHYKKSNPDTCKQINNEAASIALKLELADRMECFSENEAFITFKDHKDNFKNNPKCRLINPAKSQVGKISKIILENINNAVRNKTKLLQWRNTGEVIKWYEDNKDHGNCKFTQFDICEFYPSTRESLLEKV